MHPPAPSQPMEKRPSPRATVYGGKVVAKAPNGKAIRGYLAKGDGCNVVFRVSADGSSWGDPYIDNVTNHPYFKAEVESGTN